MMKMGFFNAFFIRFIADCSYNKVKIMLILISLRFQNNPLL
jgi:hypothetical protein